MLLIVFIVYISSVAQITTITDHQLTTHHQPITREGGFAAMEIEVAATAKERAEREV